MRPSGVYDVNYVQAQSILRTRVDWFWTVAILGILLLLPQYPMGGILGIKLMSPQFLNLLTTSGILLISITGLNLLLGYTGQISLGQAAFMMVGAYTAAVIARETEVPFILSIVISALMAGVIGLFFGLSSLRVKGFYLAMATLAAQFIIPWAINTYEGDWFNLGKGNPLPVPRADILGYEITSNRQEYYLVLAFVVITAIAARNLIRSRVGRAWISIRDNDLAAEQLGINVFRYKALAFFISAVYAGIAGGLDAHVSRSVTSDSFSLEFSIEQLAMLVIGGAGFPLGPFFGVAFFKFIDRYVVDWLNEFSQDVLPDILTFLNPDYIPVGMPHLLLGILLAAFLIYEPRGIAFRWMILQAAWRLRPFSKA
ncbi:MAG: branched-chain amino acid ABC transporter permease [Chloroflexi bacterium]|nr:branched-chain amino acid ABC transporter permease [Chloroflexota bacterium]